MVKGICIDTLGSKKIFDLLLDSEDILNLNKVTKSKYKDNLLKIVKKNVINKGKVISFDYFIYKNTKKNINLIVFGFTDLIKNNSKENMFSKNISQILNNSIKFYGDLLLFKLDNTDIIKFENINDLTLNELDLVFKELIDNKSIDDDDDDDEDEDDEDDDENVIDDDDDEDDIDDDDDEDDDDEDDINNDDNDDNEEEYLSENDFDDDNLDMDLSKSKVNNLKYNITDNELKEEEYEYD